MMHYAEAEAYINNIPRFSKIKSEENVAAILTHFGHPEMCFSYIHVAGTNGKGSVCAFLDSMLRAGGIKTGLFTSPHLITMTERMKVDGEDISETEFVEIFEELLAVVEERQKLGHPHPTYFEWLYLMAMIWFGRCGIAYGVIETGLGGRLDATNQIKKPALTVITSISYDHMEILGNTLTEIAAEKAGILKDGVPVVCDGSEEEALAVIAKRAEALNCPIKVLMPQQLKILLNHGDYIDFELEDGYDKRYDIHVKTGAVYQTMNGGLAWLAMKELQKQSEELQKISDDRLLQGMAQMHWRARMEEILPRVLVDGAHNVGGVRMLCESLAACEEQRPIWLVFAVASDKDYGQMAELLCGIKGLKGIIVTEIQGSRRTPLEDVAAVFAQKWQGYVGKNHDIQAAIAEGRRRTGTEGLLVCAGSLYLAGSVLEGLKG